MAKKMTITKAKKEAWKWFSKYIRKRDSLNGHFVCCSCGRMYEEEKAQAGHFIPGRKNAVLYSEEGTHAQCYNCNMNLQGNWPGYYQFMKEKYGQKVIDRLLEDSKEIVQMKAVDHLEVAEKYRLKYNGG